eukprot:225979-Hanusia_phi.AAC.1
MQASRSRPEPGQYVVLLPHAAGGGCEEAGEDCCYARGRGRGIASTTLKLICRKLGVSRWPYRQRQKQERVAALHEGADASRGGAGATSG